MNILKKNIGYLFIGNIISQIISLIGIVYIPKIMGVENYGIFQIILNFIAMFSILTLPGFDRANINEIIKDKLDVNEVLNKNINLNYIVSIIGSLLISILAFILYKNTIIISGIILLSLTIIIVSIKTTIETIYKINEKLKYVALFSILNSLLITTGTLVIINLTDNIVTLLLWQVISQVLLFTIVKINLKNVFKFRTPFKVGFPNKIQMIRGGNYTIINVLNIVGSKIDIFMLSLLTNPIEVGIYALAQRFFEKSKLFGNAVNDALFPNYSKKKFNNFKIIYKHAVTLTLIGAGTGLLLYFTSKFVITNYIGTNFLSSIDLIKVLSINFIFGFSTIPFGSYLEVSGNEKYVIQIKSFRAILNILLNLVFYFKYGLIGVAYSTIACTLIQAFLTIYIARVIFKRNQNLL